MHIYIYLLLFGILTNMEPILASLSISKVILRVPKENDIGLIFDVNVVNTQTDKKEMLEYQVRSDGCCCVNLTYGQIMRNASRIVGGNFGSIETGACHTVSLIWPTVSLYNRVGSCPIAIISTNAKGEEVNMKQAVHFDTRFTVLDPEGHTLRKHKDYIDCGNWDLDYFKNCTPVDCEERYFGRRSYYNSTAQRCEEIPYCSGLHQRYDGYSNECVDTQNFCTEEDMEAIRQGKFDNNVLDLKCNAPTGPIVVINDNNDDKGDDGLHEETKVVTRSADNDTTQSEERPLLPYWLKGLLDGLLIVCATIAIYVLICFGIFLIVSWISRKHFDDGPKGNCALSSSGTSLPLYTHSSLLSQR